jgi:hypothetical protein
LSYQPKATNPTKAGFVAFLLVRRSVADYPLSITVDTVAVRGEVYAGSKMAHRDAAQFSHIADADYLAAHVGKGNDAFVADVDGGIQGLTYRVREHLETNTAVRSLCRNRSLVAGSEC